LSLLISTRSVDLIVIAWDQIPAERLHNLQTLCRAHSVSLSRIRVGIEEIVTDRAEPAPDSPGAVVNFPTKN
jgi:hypothetical protein